MNESAGENLPIDPPVDVAMEAAMSMEPVNTRGQIVGLGVAGLRAVALEQGTPEFPPKQRVFPGEATYTSTADRLRARELKDSQAEARHRRQQRPRRDGPR